MQSIVEKKRGNFLRQHYIDNIRWLSVLLLFPYHTARIFDGVNSFYIKGPESPAATVFVLSCTPWFMPILFVVAGISTRYALQKRSGAEYIKERFTRLLVPLLCGILLLIPLQTYFAEVFHNAYAGGYWEQYLLFFTKPTDFSGYSGGFTPGQLWFLWYLFVVSLAALPVIHAVNRKRPSPRVSHWMVIPLFLVPFLLSYVLEIGGKSMGEYFSLFLLGYFVASDSSIQEFTDKYRFAFLIAGAALTFCTVVFQTSSKEGAMARGIMTCTSWICILAILGLGHRYLNFQNTWTRYLSQSSFSCYLFHQSWIIVLGFYLLQTPLSIGLQYGIILVGSLLGSLMAHALCKRWKVLRWMFGIKEAPGGKALPAAAE